MNAVSEYGIYLEGAAIKELLLEKQQYDKTSANKPEINL
jgi:hypothetical protein